MLKLRSIFTKFRSACTPQKSGRLLFVTQSRLPSPFLFCRLNAFSASSFSIPHTAENEERVTDVATSLPFLAAEKTNKKYQGIQTNQQTFALALTVLQAKKKRSFLYIVLDRIQHLRIYWLSISFLAHISL